MARKQKDNIVRLSDFDEPLNTNGTGSDGDSVQKKSRLYSTNQSQNNNNDNDNDNGETEEGGENTKSNKGRPKEKKPTSKKKKAAIIVASLAVLGGAGFGGYTYYQNKLELEQYNQTVYSEAISLVESGRYSEAIEKFNSIPNYSDSLAQAEDAQERWDAEVYAEALEKYENNEFEQAIEMFNSLAEREYMDSADKVKQCVDTQRYLYIQNLGKMSYKVNKYKELSASLGRMVIDTWKKAEDSGKSQAQIKADLEALYKTREQDIKKMKIGHDGLDAQISPITKLGGAEEAYDNFQKLYQIYLDTYESVLKPSGEFGDYKKKLTDYSNEFDSLLQKMFVNEPGIKQEFDAQAEKERIENLNNGIQIMQ